MSNTEKQSFSRIAFVYRMQKQVGRTLISSLLDEIAARGIHLDEYNLYNEKNLYDDSILDTLYKKRKLYDLVFVLDLGYLYDYRIHKSQYNCPVVLIAGDDPQNFLPKKGLAQKLKRYLKRKLFSSVDHNQLIGNAICAKQYDIVFTHQKNCVQMYREQGIENAHWLPYWCDTFIHNKKKDIAVTADVTTVMKPQLRRKKTLAFLEQNRAFTFSNGAGKYNNDAAAHYQTGKIVFNQSNHDEMTIRIPESLGGGNFLLTDEIPVETGLYDLYTPGEHFATYTDQNDLEEKIKYYLAHDEERKRIAEAGYTHTLQHHTQAHRLDMIFETAQALRKESAPKKVSIHMISWNRPWLLKLTLDSLRNSLKGTQVPYEVIVYDQRSDFETRNILRDYFDIIDKVVNNPVNDGMAQAWVTMYSLSNAEYIVPIENDWLCDAHSDRWLEHALEIMQKEPDIAFIKLRAIHDRQFGNGSINHEPWTVKPFPADIVEIGELSDGKKYYAAAAQYNCFTFNPVLMRKEFRDEFDKYYKDNANNYDPLRSGEDLPQEKWREQNKWKSASLTDGPFRHIGFNELKEHAFYLPQFLVRHFINGVRVILR
ncbi:MAG: glycosyltransferase [Candidatus Dojkabacteria bacterium]|nr:MAG: glycosyltransferase [Candidatus Dojkabacteria bacterium]